MSAANFSHSAVTTADAHLVWSQLQRAETWLALGVMDTVTNEQTHRGGLIGFDWTASVGGKAHRGTARTIENPSGHGITLRLRSSEIEGELSVVLRPAPSGTTVAVQLAVRPRGFLAGMFWGRISQSIERGLPAKVEEFARRF